MAKRRKPNRGHNAGSVHQRKDGRWVGALLVGYDEAGRPKRKAFYGKTREEAEGKLLEAMRDHRQGVLFDPTKETVKEFLERWLRDSVKHSNRPRTYRTYESASRVHLVPTLGHLPLVKLTPAHLQGLYAKKLEAGLSPKTVVNIHATIHRALKQAVRWGQVPRNVADAVDRPKVEHTIMKVLTLPQVNRLLAAAREDRLHALYVLAVTTGARQGELLGLTWDKLDLDAGRMEITQQLQWVGEGCRPVFLPPKSARGRRNVNLPPMAVEVLRHHRRRQGEERLALGEAWGNWNLVFTTTIGTPLEPQNLYRRSWRALLERLDQEARAEDPKGQGFPRIRFHDLRHTSATLLLQAGEHPKIVQEMLGHANISLTLDVYSHVLPSMQQKAAARMQELLTAAQVKQ